MIPAKLIDLGGTILILAALVTGSPACRSHTECGWNSVCEEGECRCAPQYALSGNNKDCVDKRCSDSKCLDCITPNTCRRCLDFIEENTGKCLDKCDSPYQYVIEGVQVGKVCQVSQQTALRQVYLAVIIGVLVGVLLTVVTSLAFYCRMKSREKQLRLKLGERAMEREKKQKENTKVEKQYLAEYDNHSYATVDSPQQRSMNSLQFMQQVSALKPHIDTFLAMLREAKIRYRQLETGDPKGSIYRNVIHQLCRVLGILNDTGAVIPTDGIELLIWADKVLKEYLKTHEPPKMESPTNTLTSTFKPDHRLVPNGHLPGEGSTRSTSYIYERLEPPTLPKHDNSAGESCSTLTDRIDDGEDSDIETFEAHVLQLAEQEFTAPIEV